MTLLAIDPGRSFTVKGKARQSIGVSLQHFSDGAEAYREAISFEQLCARLIVEKDYYGELKMTFYDTEEKSSGWVISEIVIEDFVNDPKSARGGQRNGTSECIGAVEILAIQSGVPFARQRSSILGPAKLLADYQGKAKHLPHQDSAYLHGYYYLVQKGVLSSKGLQGTM